MSDGVSPRLGIATVCLSGTLDDKLAAAAAAGFDGVEIFENDLVVSPWSPKQIRDRCADLGLSIDLYQPFRDFEAVPPDVLAANLRRAEHKFDVMDAARRRHHAGLLVGVPGRGRRRRPRRRAAAPAGRPARPTAGLRIAYEALAWGRFVDTYDHSWRIVRRAGHPALGLCLDSFHVLSRGSDPAGIRVIPGEKLFFLQLADAPRLRMDVLQWSRHHRLFPGQGAFDLVRVRRPRARHRVRRAAVARGVQRRLPPGRPAPHRGRRDALAAGAPGAARGDGRRGRSASGPACRRRRRSPGTPTSRSPRRTGARWRTRCAPWVSARRTATPVAAGRRPDPAARHRTTAPGSRRSVWTVPTRRSRCAARNACSPRAVPGRCGRRARRHRDRLRPTAVRDAGRRPGLLTGIDHVSLTAPFDDVDQTALFYRAVLGLEPEPATEFAAPFGLVRSLSASDPDRRVRIAHNVAMLRRGEWAPAVPDPQHVAFTTDDAIAAAPGHAGGRRAAARHPATTTTTTSTPGSPHRASAELRENSVLYDRDDARRAAALLHAASSAAGCSSRWCSASAATPATARRTRRCGWPPTANRACRPRTMVRSCGR